MSGFWLFFTCVLSWIYRNQKPQQKQVSTPPLKKPILLVRLKAWTKISDDTINHHQKTLKNTINKTQKQNKTDLNKNVNVYVYCVQESVKKETHKSSVKLPRPSVHQWQEPHPGIRKASNTWVFVPKTCLLWKPCSSWFCMFFVGFCRCFYFFPTFWGFSLNKCLETWKSKDKILMWESCSL